MNDANAQPRAYKSKLGRMAVGARREALAGQRRGEKLAGPDGSFEAARRTIKGWLGGRAEPATLMPGRVPPQEYRNQRFEKFKTESKKVEAEITAYADDQHEQKLAADR